MAVRAIWTLPQHPYMGLTRGPLRTLSKAFNSDGITRRQHREQSQPREFLQGDRAEEPDLVPLDDITLVWTCPQHLGEDIRSKLSTIGVQVIPEHSNGGLCG